MNRENLTKLVDGLIGLRQAPEEVERFTMEVWARTNPCGTFGCAIGTAALKGWIPEFRMQGPVPFFAPTGEFAWYAVLAAFGITWDEAHWLFSRRAYSDEICDGLRALDAVITRVARVLAEGFPTITSAMLQKFPFAAGCDGW